MCAGESPLPSILTPIGKQWWANLETGANFYWTQWPNALAAIANDYDEQYCDANELSVTRVNWHLEEEKKNSQRCASLSCVFAIALCLGPISKTAARKTKILRSAVCVCACKTCRHWCPSLSTWLFVDTTAADALVWRLRWQDTVDWQYVDMTQERERPGKSQGWGRRHMRRHAAPSRKKSISSSKRLQARRQASAQPATPAMRGTVYRVSECVCVLSQRVQAVRRFKIQKVKQRSIGHLSLAVMTRFTQDAPKRRWTD